jgi:hypothetical protein
MKNKLVLILLRVLFYAGAFLGLLMILASMLPFEEAAVWFNKLSSDGQFESFTADRFQMLRIPLGLAGVCLAILFGWAAFRWDKSQEYFNRFFAWMKNISVSFRQDAKEFRSDIREAFIRLTWMDHILLGGSIFAALVFRLYQLNAPLLADEAYTYNAFASGSLWVTVSDYHLPNNHVFLSVLVNILTHLLGNHIWLMRLPTMVAGMLMIPAVYVLARMWYGRNAALLSAAFVAVFPILVMYSVWARGYGIVSLITVLILILGEYVRVHQNRFAWSSMITLSVVGFFTVPIMLFPFGAVYLWLFLSWLIGDLNSYGSKWDFIKYWLASGFTSALLTVLVYTPILIKDYDRFFHNQFVAPVEWEKLPASLADGLHTMWLDWTSSIPIVLTVIALIGLIASFVFYKRLSRQKVPVLFAFLVWIGALIIIRRPDMNARLWLFMAAPLLISSAGGIAGILEMVPSLFGKNFNVAYGVVSLVVVSVFLGSLMTIPRIPERWRQKGNIENTVLFFKDNLREGDIVNASTNSLSVIRYYFSVYDIPLKYVRRSGEFQRAFLVLSRETDSLETLSPVDGSKRPLINLDTAKRILEFDGLTVYECYPVP